MIVLVPILILAAYLAAGWLLAVRNLPRAWEKARHEWSYDDIIRNSVKGQTIAMVLFWPVYLSWVVAARRLDNAIDRHDPVRLQEQIRDRDQKITELERELGMRP